MLYLGETGAFLGGLHLFELLERFNYTQRLFIVSEMVLSIIDEHKPKCYLCNDTFENMDELRKHQEEAHKEFMNYHRKKQEHTPAPGDVTLF